MYILLPIDSKNLQEAKLTKLNDVKIWVQLLVEEGSIKETKFSETMDGFENFSECVVVENDNEYVWPFMELSMMVLVAHTQRTIDDIVEAYLFKELHDLAI
ncbi:MAG: hypothetical protein L3I99_02490 [Sulfurimonas sp.]|nr:hypothetical protein [Sulfurimonas sp.]